MAVRRPLVSAILLDGLRKQGFPVKMVYYPPEGVYFAIVSTKPHLTSVGRRKYRMN